MENKPKRPDWLFDDTHPTKMDWPSRRRQARRYIEHLEDALDERDRDLERLYARVKELETT